jgi:hypothetical protein
VKLLPSLNHVVNMHYIAGGSWRRHVVAIDVDQHMPSYLNTHRITKTLADVYSRVVGLVCGWCALFLAVLNSEPFQEVLRSRQT